MRRGVAERPIEHAAQLNVASGLCLVAVAVPAQVDQTRVRNVRRSDKVDMNTTNIPVGEQDVQWVSRERELT